MTLLSTDHLVSLVHATITSKGLSSLGVRTWQPLLLLRNQKISDDMSEELLSDDITLLLLCQSSYCDRAIP